MTAWVIGVDCSTTGVKAVAFDADGTALAEGRAGLTRSSPHPGWAEQSSGQWWEATRSALQRLMAIAAEQRLGAPLALGITHQRESFVCLDEEGRDVRPGILWLDGRAGPQVSRYGSPEVHRTSGKPPSTTPSLYKLLWLLENEPDVLRRTRWVADVHAVLSYRLTGRFATSTASADPTALLDMLTFDWSDSLLTLTGLTRDRLPDLVPPGDVIGVVRAHAAAETGLPDGLPVVAGAGDGQAAGLGAAAVRIGEAYLSLGTSLTLGVQSSEYRVATAYRTLASPVAGAYTLEGLIAAGMLSLGWLRENILQLPDTAEGIGIMTDRARSSSPAAGGLLFLPYLTGAETPYWDAAARGAVVGLGEHHSGADLARAVFEGLALESRLLLEAQQQDLGAPVTTVTTMGGGSRSELLLQTLADVLGRDIAVAAEVETAALGAAMLAARGVHLEGQTDVTAISDRMSRVGRLVEPGHGDRALYDDLFAAYRGLYPALRDTFAALSRIRERRTPPAGAQPVL